MKIAAQSTYAENSKLTIGLTYDLRSEYLKNGYTEEETAEFDSEDTVTAIETTLQKLGYKTDCIGNVKTLVSRLARGDQWDLVFNIAEGMYGIGRESQIPAILDAYDIPYTFSDPLVLALSLHKGMAKHVVRDIGITTPAFFVVENENDLDKINLPFPLFVKPVAEGTGKGISITSKVLDKKQLLIACKNVLENFHQPALVEVFLPGREFTVGIVGTGSKSRVIGGVLEVLLLDNAEADIYSYHNKEYYDQLVHYQLVIGEIAEKVKKVALATWIGLSCHDAGRVDIRCDEHGLPHFLEINPLAGLNPIRSDLPIACNLSGIAYKDLIKEIMESAKERLKLHPKKI
ncbi:D-alanine--D-alanine ligase [bacterium]|nr:D-alanine--D-alanine ligase [bacterium]